MAPHKKPTRSDAPSENVVLVEKGSTENEIIRVGPHKLEILEDGRNTDNRFGAAYLTVPPHTAGPPQHWHQMHDESFLVMKGTATFTTRDKKVVCHQGNYVVVPPNSPHTFANETDEELLLYTTYTPAYYINYFRLMAEMSKSPVDGSSGMLTPSMIKKAMSNYATIQIKPGYDWSQGDGKDLATDLSYFKDA